MEKKVSTNLAYLSPWLEKKIISFRWITGRSKQKYFYLIDNFGYKNECENFVRVNENNL